MAFIYFYFWLDACRRPLKLHYFLFLSIGRVVYAFSSNPDLFALNILTNNISVLREKGLERAFWGSSSLPFLLPLLWCSPVRCVLIVCLFDLGRFFSSVPVKKRQTPFFLFQGLLSGLFCCYARFARCLQLLESPKLLLTMIYIYTIYMYTTLGYPHTLSVYTNAFGQVSHHVVWHIGSGRGEFELARCSQWWTLGNPHKSCKNFRNTCFLRYCCSWRTHAWKLVCSWHASFIAGAVITSLSSWERIFAACVHLRLSFSMHVLLLYLYSFSMIYLFVFVFCFFFNFCDVAQLAIFWQFFYWKFNFWRFFLIINNRIFFFLNLFSQNGENSPTQKITASLWDLVTWGFFSNFVSPIPISHERKYSSRCYWPPLVRAWAFDWWAAALASHQ